jgi:hypothetical protein
MFSREVCCCKYTAPPATEAKLREELDIANKLIAERDRILEEFPCPEHGKCVPHVLELLRNEKATAATQLDKMAEFKKAYADIGEPTQDSEGHGLDRGSFKAGFFAAWKLLTIARPATQGGSDG